MAPIPEQDPLQARLLMFREAAFRIPFLTSRQYEVLHWLAGGHSNDEIAERLSITPRTVKAHVAALMGQLGVESRLELAVTAVIGHLESAAPPAARDEVLGLRQRRSASAGSIRDARHAG